MATVASIGNSHDGWTNPLIDPNGSGQTFYCSQSLGNDSYDGTAPTFQGGSVGPKQTVSAAVGLLTDGVGDHLRFRRGDTWTNESIGNPVLSGAAANDPMVFWYYGDTSDPRPRFELSSNQSFYASGGGAPGQNYIWIIGMDMEDTGADNVNVNYGVRFRDEASHDCLVEDCLIVGFGIGVGIAGGNTYPSEYIYNITVRRNVIADSYTAEPGGDHRQAIYIERILGGVIIEENILDRCGWDGVDRPGTSTIYSHSIYHQFNAPGTQLPDPATIIRRNISARASSHGLQARAGGEIHNNLFVQNPIHLLIGSEDDGIQCPANVTGNVMNDGEDIGGAARGNAIDLNWVDGVEITNNLITKQETGGDATAIRTTAMNDAPNFIDADNVNIDNNIFHNYGGFNTNNGATVNDLTNWTITNTDIQIDDASVAAQLINVAEANHVAEMTLGGNRYWHDFSATPMTISGTGAMTVAAFNTALSDGTSTETQVSYTDATRDVASYNASLGGAATIDAFMTACRAQERWSWDPAYTAVAAIEWIKQGFSMESFTVNLEFTQPNGTLAASPSTVYEYMPVTATIRNTDFDGTSPPRARIQWDWGVSGELSIADPRPYMQSASRDPATDLEGFSAGYIYQGPQGSVTVTATITLEDGRQATASQSFAVLASTRTGIWVNSVIGDDIGGDGSPGNPYETLTFALAAHGSDTDYNLIAGQTHTVDNEQVDLTNITNIRIHGQGVSGNATISYVNGGGADLFDTNSATSNIAVDRIEFINDEAWDTGDSQIWGDIGASLVSMHDCEMVGETTGAWRKCYGAEFNGFIALNCFFTGTGMTGGGHPWSPTGHELIFMGFNTLGSYNEHMMRWLIGTGDGGRGVTVCWGDLQNLNTIAPKGMRLQFSNYTVVRHNYMRGVAIALGYDSYTCQLTRIEGNFVTEGNEVLNTGSALSFNLWGKNIAILNNIFSSAGDPNTTGQVINGNDHPNEPSDPHVQDIQEKVDLANNTIIVQPREDAFYAAFPTVSNSGMGWVHGTSDDGSVDIENYHAYRWYNNFHMLPVPPDDTTNRYWTVGGNDITYLFASMNGNVHPLDSQVNTAFGEQNSGSNFAFSDWTNHPYATNEIQEQHDPYDYELDPFVDGNLTFSTSMPIPATGSVRTIADPVTWVITDYRGVTRDQNAASWAAGAIGLEPDDALTIDLAVGYSVQSTATDIDLVMGYSLVAPLQTDRLPGYSTMFPFTVDRAPGYLATGHMAFNPAPPGMPEVTQTWNTFSVELRDAGDTVITTEDHNVTLSLVSGVGNLGGTLTVPTSNGVATFNDITYDTAEAIEIQFASENGYQSLSRFPTVVPIGGTMPVVASDIYAMAAADMPTDDVSAYGGAIDTAHRILLVGDLVTAQVVGGESDSGSDITDRTATITGRNASGAVVSEQITFNGLTRVDTTTVFRYIDHIVEDGAAKTGNLTFTWDPLSAGAGPTEILVLQNAGTSPTGSATTEASGLFRGADDSADPIYAKFFLLNTNGSDTISNCTVSVPTWTATASENVDWDLADAQNDTAQMGDRTTTPSNAIGVWNDAGTGTTVNVPGDQALGPGEEIAVYIRLDLSALTGSVYGDDFTARLSGTV